LLLEGQKVTVKSLKVLGLPVPEAIAGDTIGMKLSAKPDSEKKANDYVYLVHCVSSFAVPIELTITVTNVK
jgi:selenocysteine-specific translation elongation factor